MGAAALRLVSHPQRPFSHLLQFSHRQYCRYHNSSRYSPQHGLHKKNMVMVAGAPFGLLSAVSHVILPPLSLLPRDVMSQYE
jgi:hypothetical protein